MSKVTIPEFAAAIRKKYNAYDNVPDTLLAEKILEKYPQYKETVDFSYLNQNNSQQAPVVPPSQTATTRQVDTPTQNFAPVVQSTDQQAQQRESDPYFPDVNTPPAATNTPPATTNTPPEQGLTTFGQTAERVMREQAGPLAPPTATERAYNQQKPEIERTRQRLLEMDPQMFDGKLEEYLQTAEGLTQLSRQERDQLLFNQNDPEDSTRRRRALDVYNAYQDYRRAILPVERLQYRDIYDQIAPELKTKINEGLEESASFAMPLNPSTAMAGQTPYQGGNPMAQQNYQFANQLLGQTDRIIKAANSGTLEQTARGLTAPIAEDWLSMNWNKAVRDHRIYAIVNKAENGQQLTQDEEAFIEAVGLHTNVRAAQLTNMGFDVTQGMSEMIPFMVWFAATRTPSEAVAGSLKGGAKNAVEWLTKNGVNLSNKTLQNIGRFGIEHAKWLGAAPMFPNTYSSGFEAATGDVNFALNEQGRAELQTTEGDNPWVAAGKGLISGASEIFGERLFSDIIKVPTRQIAREISRNPNGLKRFMAHLQDNIKWSGTLNEYVEENYTSLWQEGILEGNLDFLGAREQMVLFLTVAGFGGTMSGMNAIANEIGYDAQSKDQAMVKLKQQQSAELVERTFPEQIGEIQQLLGKDAETQVNGIAQLADQHGWNLTQMQTAMDFLFWNNNYESMAEAMQEEKVDQLEQNEAPEIDYGHEDGTVKKGNYNDEPVVIIKGQLGDDVVVIEKPDGSREMVNPNELEDVEEIPLEQEREIIAGEKQQQNAQQLADEEINQKAQQEMGKNLLPGMIIEINGEQGEVLAPGYDPATGVVVRFGDTPRNITPADVAGITIVEQKEPEKVASGPVLELGDQKFDLTPIDRDAWMVTRTTQSEAQAIADQLQGEYEQLQFTLEKRPSSDPFKKAEYEVIARIRQEQPIEQQQIEQLLPEQPIERQDQAPEEIEHMVEPGKPVSNQSEIERIPVAEQQPARKYAGYLSVKSGNRFNSVDSNQDGYSAYRIFDVQGDSAQFDLADIDKSILMANADAYFDRVASTTGNKYNFTSAKVIEPGHLRKVGNAWEVTKPIKIELIDNNKKGKTEQPLPDKPIESRSKQEFNAQAVIDNANYQPRHADGKIVRIPITSLIEKQDPNYKVERGGENEISGRIDRAKAFLQKATENLEAPSIYFRDDDTIGFEDGRHRVIAAQELGATHVMVEITDNEEQNERLQKFLNGESWLEPGAVPEDTPKQQAEIKPDQQVDLKNPYQFKAGDIIRSVYSEKEYKVINPDRKGMAELIELKNIDEYEADKKNKKYLIEEWNAHNNPHFVLVKSLEKLQQAEAQVNPNPSEAQKQAGNYQKGHARVQGMEITIETPKGSVRSGTDPQGKKWEVTLNNTYGYFRRTKGKDGDQIDVFIGDNLESDKVFIVDQVNTDGEFDEHKVMLGFDNVDQAREAYLSNYSPGWQGLGDITETTIELFKEWLDNGTRKRKPAAEYKAFKSELVKPEFAGGFLNNKEPKATRQEPITNRVEGVVTNREFADNVAVAGRLAVIEVDELQPSHKDRRRNPLHGIPEAQPKERNDAASDAESTRIANNPDWGKLANKTLEVYHGAPTVNSRGEVIQGNNRSEALLKYWERNDPKGLKQYLIDNASELGLNPDEVTKMKKPVLVNMIDVDDKTAIVLGQYTAADLESGGKRRITPKETLRKLNSDEANRLVEIITKDSSPDDTIRESIRANAIEALKYLFTKKAINETQLQSAVKDNAITKEGMDDLAELLKYNLFRGAEANFDQYFEKLSYRVQNALIKTAHIGSKKTENSLLPFIQDAIRGYGQYLAVSGKDVSMTPDQWYRMIDMFEGKSPADTYNPLSFHLLKEFLQAKTEKALVEKIREYYTLVNGIDDGFFPEQPISMQQALHKVFNFTENIESHVKRYANERAGISNAAGSIDRNPNEGQRGGRSGSGASMPRGNQQNKAIDGRREGSTPNDAPIEIKPENDDSLNSTIDGRAVGGVSPSSPQGAGSIDGTRNVDAIKKNTSADRGRNAEPSAVAAVENAGDILLPQKIEDFGEKIEGAKKDIYKRLDASLSDIESQPLSKTFPRPDFVKLVETGSLSEDGAIILKFFYEQIPAKPRKKHALQRWVTTVSKAVDLYNELMQNPEMVEKWMKDLPLRYPGIATDFNKFRKIQKALGFPKEDINTGAYEIMYFDRHKRWSVTKGNYILSDHNTIEEAADGLKAILNKPKDTGVKFGIYQDRISKEYFIGKSTATGVQRVMTGLESVKQAREIIESQQQQLEAIWEGMKITPVSRREQNRERKGDDYRKGREITPDEFMETFAFRGVQFGNYVNNKERQDNLNRAYDALMDLSAVLGVSPKALSLGGELALAFGARGSGGVDAAMAHYESDQIVINLTKNKGAGSLAHEWWHGLDNYFSRKRGEKIGFLTEKPRQGITREGKADERVRAEMHEAFKAVTKAIKESGLPQRSKKIDDTKSKLYWSTMIEMSARSFENFIIEGLGVNGNHNDYLANFKESGQWISTGFDIDAYPYPLKEETEGINNAFKLFFDTIDEKAENGHQVLYSVKGKLKPRKSINNNPVPIERNAGDYLREIPYLKQEGNRVIPNASMSEVQELMKQARRIDPSVFFDNGFEFSTEEKAREFVQMTLDVIEMKTFPKYDSLADLGVLEPYTEYNTYKVLSRSKQQYAAELIKGYENRMNRAGADHTHALNQLQAKKKEFGQEMQTKLFDLNTQGSLFDLPPSDMEKALKPYRDAIAVTRRNMEELQNGYKNFVDEVLEGQQGQQELMFKVQDRQGYNYRAQESWTADEIAQAEQKAIDRFGLTLNPKEAGYITADGSLIDFSGKKDGKKSGVKNYDHSKIVDALTGIDLKSFSPKRLVKNGRLDMVTQYGLHAFMDMGNIRITDNVIQLRHEPTYQQYDAIRKVMEGYKEVYIEIHDTNIKTTGEEAEIEIRNYFGSNRIPGTIDNYIAQGIYTRSDLINFVRFNDPYSNFKLGPHRIYDNAEMALMTSTMAKGTKAQWKADLLKNGAKEYELEWKNFDELEDRVYSREEIEQWNRENKVEIEVVRKQGGEFAATAEQFDGTNIIKKHIPGSDYLKEGDWVVVDAHGGYTNIFGATQEEALLNARELYDSGEAGFNFSGKGDTKYTKYQIAQGENYQEWLMRIPEKRISKPYEVWLVENFTGEDTKEARELYSIQTEGVSYKSGHWNESNVLVHVRMSDFVSKDGKKILTLQEVQSDWAQDGRKKGFQSKDKKPLVDIMGNEVVSDTRNYDGSVPQMPFTSTPQWLGLGMRHVIEYAVDNGYDGVAWGTGKQMADVFSLRKQIDSITYTPENKITFPGIVRAYPKSGNQTPIVKRVENENELADEIGKELAKKIVDGARDLKGDGLEVGGEGMKGFYDGIVPGWVNKNLKKYGVKAGTTQIDTNPAHLPDAGGLDTITGEVKPKPGSDYLDVHYFDITDTMYQAVAKGQPMYKRGTPQRNYNRVKGTIETLNNRMQTTSPYIIIDTQSEILEAMEQLGENKDVIAEVGANLDKTIHAFLSPSGIIYYIAENMPTTTKGITEVWMHEQGLHGGLRSLIPKARDRRRLMERVYDSVGEEGIKEMIGASYESYKDAPKWVKGEEYLGHLAEKMETEELLQPVDKAMWKKIVGWINEILTKIYKFTVKFTDAEIRMIVRASVQSLHHADMPDPATGTSVRYSATPGQQPKGQRKTIIYNPIDPGKWGSFIRGIQDRYRPLRKLQQEIEKRSGQVPDWANPYEFENRSRSLSKYQIEQFNASEWRRLIEVTAVLSKKNSLETIARYMIAKHAPERNFYLEIAFEVKDGSGMSDKEADYAVKEFEKDYTPKEIAAFWAAKQAATDFTLLTGLKTGLISKESYDIYKSRYQYYVPLRSWEGTKPEDVYDYVNNDLSDSGYNPLKKHAKGRRTIADHPIPFIGSMAHSAIVEGNKNLVKLQLLQLARLNPNMHDLMQLQKTWWVFDGQQWNQTTIKPAQDIWDKGWVKQKRSMDHYLYNTYNLATQHELKVTENGEDYIVILNDPLVIQPLKFGLDPLTEWVQKTWLARYTRALARWHTASNPAFILPNMARDIRFALNMNYIEKGTKYTAQFMINIPKSQGAIVRAIRGKENMSNKTDQLYREWLEHGGPTGYVHLWDIRQFKRQIEKDVKKLNSPNLDMVNLAKHESNLMEKLARWSEDTTRFAAYLTARENGKSIIESIRESKEVSTNFDRKGKWSGLLGSLYNFFNANIQGIERTIRMYRKHPLKASVVSAFTLAKGFLMAYMFDLLGGDDEEGIPKYDKVSDYLKHRYSVYAIPGSEIYVTIPQAHGLRMWNAFGWLAYDMYSGRKTAAEALPWMIDATSDSFTPVDIGGLVNSEGNPSIRPLVPSALTPVYEIAVNENFAGFPITREPYTQGQEYIPRSQRHFRNVNQAAKGFTRELFRIGGGDPDLPNKYYYDGGIHKVHPWMDINPAHIDYLLSNVLGGKGQFYNQLTKMTLSTIETATEQLKGEKTMEESLAENYHAMDIPILNRWVRQPLSDVLSREYYEQRNNERTWSNTLRLYENAMKWDKVEEMRMSDEYEQLLRNSTIHESVDDLRELEESLRAIENMKTEEQINRIKEKKAERIQEIEENINQLNPEEDKEQIERLRKRIERIMQAPDEQLNESKRKRMQETLEP